MFNVFNKREEEEKNNKIWIYMKAHENNDNTNYLVQCISYVY